MRVWSDEAYNPIARDHRGLGNSGGRAIAETLILSSTLPPEAILFFPWGTKPPKPLIVDPKEPDVVKRKAAEEKAQRKAQADPLIRDELLNSLKGRLQFGGLEGLGRGWADLKTVALTKEQNV